MPGNTSRWWCNLRSEEKRSNRSGSCRMPEWQTKPAAFLRKCRYSEFDKAEKRICRLRQWQLRTKLPVCCNRDCRARPRSVSRVNMRWANREPECSNLWHANMLGRMAKGAIRREHKLAG